MTNVPHEQVDRRPSRGLALIFALLCLVWFQPAQARRAALIIGNSNYVQAPLLANPEADARLVANAARRAGFDVTLLTDLSRAAFDEALRRFRPRADGAEIAMIYYAGHGIESAGRNWVVPTDAILREVRDLRFEAIELDGLLETLDGAQRRIVVLDACRNNPFGGAWRATARTVQKGLAETEAQGALVMYAAAGGQVASDGAAGNSPFAQSLARRMDEPGLSIHRLGAAVRSDVVAATGGRQTPWTSMNIDSSEFFLVAPQAGTSPGGGPATGGQASSGQASGEALADAYAWRYADSKNTVGDYQDYLAKFPRGVFAADATARLAKLRAGDRSRRGGSDGRRGEAQAGGDSPALAATQPSQAQGVAGMPSLPAAPLFPGLAYPDCREDYQRIPSPKNRVVNINACLRRIDGYAAQVLNVYPQTMSAHKSALMRVYDEQVKGQSRYTSAQQQRFLGVVQREQGESNPDGAYFTQYRAAKARYDQDRAYLQQRVCAYSGSCRAQ